MICMDMIKIKNDYIKYSKIRDEYLVDFNYKKHNYATKKIIIIHQKIKKDRDALTKFVDELFDNKESIKLQIAICDLSIEEKYRREEAIEKLIKISMEDIGVFEVDLKMSLVDYGLLNIEDMFLDDWRDRVKRV